MKSMRALYRRQSGSAPEGPFTSQSWFLCAQRFHFSRSQNQNLRLVREGERASGVTEGGRHAQSPTLRLLSEPTESRYVTLNSQDQKTAKIHKHTPPLYTQTPASTISVRTRGT